MICAAGFQRAGESGASAGPGPNAVRPCTVTAYAQQAGVPVAAVSDRRKEDGAQKAPLQPAALAKARPAYQDFLTLWKDADPDIPILKEAKAEYAKLK